MHNYIFKEITFFTVSTNGEMSSRQEAFTVMLIQHTKSILQCLASVTLLEEIRLSPSQLAVNLVNNLVLRINLYERETAAYDLLHEYEQVSFQQIIIFNRIRANYGDSKIWQW